MVQPPERYTPETIPPREYIFILDVSGSMYGFPLDTSKELIRNLAGSLRETDRFNVILFPIPYPDVTGIRTRHSGKCTKGVCPH